MESARPRTPTPLLRAAVAGAALLLSACAGGAPAASAPSSDAGPADGLLAGGDCPVTPKDAGPSAPDAASDTGPADPSAPAALPELLAAWEAGALPLEALTAAVATTTTPPGEALPATVSGLLWLPGRDAPYASGDAAVPAGATLVLGPGATIALADGATLDVAGRLYALGTPAAPVTIAAAEGESYSTVRLTGGPNVVSHAALDRGAVALDVQGIGATPTLVADTRIDWYGQPAIAFADAAGLRITRCRIGTETPQELGHAEAINGQGAATIDHSVFGRASGYHDAIDLSDCSAAAPPVVWANRFLGGQDDAIDLDDCTAWIVNNLVEDFWPPDPAAPTKGVNGGGITGDRTSEPVLVGNVVRRCFHGVGFKNGARPVLVGNTIVDNHVGVTLYRGDASQPTPHAVLVNNIVWNNRHWQTGVPQDVVLDGSWWPLYDAEGQGVLDDARHNTAGQPLDGAGNATSDPLLAADGLPLPGPGSPARDSGLETLTGLTALPLDDLSAWLATDMAGTPRAGACGVFPGIDRGALEAPP